MRYRAAVLSAATIFAMFALLVGVIQPARGASEDGDKPDASQNKPEPEPADGNKSVERKPVEAPDGKEAQAGTLLVNYKEDVSENRQSLNAKGLGGEVSDRVKEINLSILKLPEQANLGRAKEALEKRPGIESVEYDYKIEAAGPNDYFYRKGRQYELTNHLRFRRAWSLGARGWDRARNRPVRAAVLDSGCNKIPDLKREIILDYDFFKRLV
jgi:hypothetical protein